MRRVAAAAELVATRPGGAVDTLVLTTGGALQLWVGTQRVAGVALGGGGAGGRGWVPVGLRDAVASRVTVLLAPAASASAATTAPLRPPAAAVAAVRADLRCTRSSSLLAAALLCGVHARVASRAPVPPPGGDGGAAPPAGAAAAVALRRALLHRRAAVLDATPRAGSGCWDDGAGHA